MNAKSAVEFITTDLTIKHLLGDIRRIASFPIPVLLTGESGVGKEIVGRLIHSWSDRCGGPFVPVNSASLSGNLFESVFFGHARGSFTGAVRKHGGLLSAAVGGTLFLDEIGELDLDLQARLLRFLDSGEYLPLGETARRESDARIIAATNRDLKAEIKRKSFREDLYYRLAAVVFRIPPLRERRVDIPLLAEYFLGLVSKEFDLGPFSLSPKVKRILAGFDWPGNVRQLRNEITAAALIKKKGVMKARDFSFDIVESDFRYRICCTDGLDGKLQKMEKDEIIGALRRSGSNCSRAADMLGLKRTTLLYRMKRHGIVLCDEDE
jgi:transcriptional regulator with PAS, ATPase and Fis domain